MDKDHELLRSCREGRVDLVVSLLTQGVNANGRETPVFPAPPPGADSFLCLQEMLEAAYEMDDFCGERSTPLIESCACGNQRIVQLLISYGACVNKKSRKGISPLTLACKFGHDGIAAYLINLGADVNAINDLGETPLAEACANGHEATVKLLIKSGAGVSSSGNGQGFGPPLVGACSNGHEGIVKLLVDQGVNINCREDRGKKMTSFMAACSNGHERIAAFLLKRGSCVNGTYGESTPLMLACGNGQERVVEVLLENGADLNRSDWTGWTPLMAACANGCKKVVEILLQKDADKDARTKRGLTAVMVTIINGELECFRKMLSVDPNLDIIDNKGKTVFAYAMEGKHVDFLKLLLDGGKLFTGGRLKHVHRIQNDCTEDIALQSLFTTIEYGVFEWEWCDIRHFKTFSLVAMRSGLYPGKIRYKNMLLSPLILAFVLEDAGLIETILDHMFYFYEDIMTLSTDKEVRNCIQDSTRYYQLTQKPMSLQTLSFLSVSKYISYSGPALLRCQRVDSLPIPHKLKRRLKFMLN